MFRPEPEIDTVYWRYDCVHHRTPRISLGIRFWGEATTDVTYRARSAEGSLASQRILQAVDVVDGHGELWMANAAGAVDPGDP